MLVNSKEFQRQLIWARDHPHSQEAKSLNVKVSQILSMVGSTIPYSPFERAFTRPKLNAIRYCYGVGSNLITGAPPEFRDLLTLRLCMNQNTMIQTVLYQNKVSHNQIFLIKYVMKLPYVCVWQNNNLFWKLKISIINCNFFYLKQSLDAKTHQKHVGVMITFNMVDVHIIILQPSMVW